MQITETNNEGLKREFKIVVEANDIRQKMDARLMEVGNTVQIPGFRPGKVPMTLLKQRFGQAVMGEILENAVNTSSEQAIAERGLRPAMQPKIEITSFEDGSDLEYTMALELMPDIEPMDFSTLKLERLTAEVTGEAVDESIQNIAEQHKNFQPVAKSRKAQSGDVLVIDFVGKIDGEEFPGGAAEDHHLELGSSSFIEGFEDQLIGLKPGDHAEVNVTFPEQYVNDQLAGKPAVFEVDVKEIRERVAVPVDEEFAKMLGLESLEKLREAVTESLTNEYAQLSKARLKRVLLDGLADNHDFPVPEGMVDIEFDTIWKGFERQREQGDIDEDDVGKSDDELKTEYRDISLRRVRLGLLLSEVGRLNNIEVMQEELNQAIMQQARQTPGREREVVEFYQNNPDALANVRAPLYENKVIDFITEMADVTERKVSLEDLIRDPDEAAAGDKKKAKAKSKSSGGSKAKSKKSASKSAKKSKTESE